MTLVFLGLGTNLGDREANLRGALAALSTHVDIQRVSSVYHSEPVGFRDQPDFWNTVVSARTQLDPHDLLDALLDVERALGRERSFRNAPRLIDIDLLLYGDRVISTDRVQVPHPRMSERAFVLRPLVELAPALRDPATGESYAERLAQGGLERIDLVQPQPELR
jgi:2-amino-4-hydroxy-6-hydroxymethyldihydropteridine diphosphokinase